MTGIKELSKLVARRSGFYQSQVEEVLRATANVMGELIIRCEDINFGDVLIRTKTIKEMHTETPVSKGVVHIPEYKLPVAKISPTLIKEYKAMKRREWKENEV